MRAMVIDGFGGPEVLHWGEVPCPEPGPGEVLVRVAFAGVNPADWKTREGMLSKYITYRFPFILGFDLAGIVVTVGPGVTGLKPGDRVFGQSKQGQGENGAYAEYTIAYEALLAPVPARVSLAEAAGLPVAGMTAYGGLVDVGALRSGQTVLVNGGAGGVGTLAIQIARALGARVAATCGPANIDYVTALGAEAAIDYRAGDVVGAVRRWAPEGVDLVLDAVGLDRLLDHATTVVKRGGRFVAIETLLSSDEDTRKAAAAAADAGVTILSNMIAVSRLGEHLHGLTALIAEGRVKPPVTEIVPLGEAGQAHARVKDGHVRGKIVLQISDKAEG